MRSEERNFSTPEITARHGLFRDTKLHVDDNGGPGRAVVLIHGWPLSGESWSAQVDATLVGFSKGGGDALLAFPAAEVAVAR